MINQGTEKRSHNVIHEIKKADIVLIAGCLLTAALLSIFLIVHRESGSMVRILCDGTEVKTLFLDCSRKNFTEATDGYYLITYKGDMADVVYSVNRPEPKPAEGTSYNLLYVSEAAVLMEEADCKDQICVHHKPVSSVGESIICLPHRLVVEITGDNDESAAAGEDEQGDNSREMPYGTLDGVVR